MNWTSELTWVTDNPLGMGEGERNQPRTALGALTGSCHEHRAWSSCISTRELLNPFFMFSTSLSSPSYVNETVLQLIIYKNGILETL